MWLLALLWRMSPFSPECWTKVVLQERAVVGSVYRPPWRYSVVQCYPNSVICHNENHLHSTLCRAHFLWMRGTGILPFIWLKFHVWFIRASPGFVHSDDSSKKVVAFPLVLVQQGLCDYIVVALLHLVNFMGYPTCCKFAVTQNMEQFCDILKTSAANSCAVKLQSASSREARSCSPCGFVLHGICLYLECFNPLCHMLHAVPEIIVYYDLMPLQFWSRHVALVL